jgi:heme exporter protein D
MYRTLQYSALRKVAVHLGYGTVRYGTVQYSTVRYGTYIWLSVSKLPLQCAVVSLHSVLKQRLKHNCLIQFLLTMVLSIEERVFPAECLSRRQ